MKNSALIITTYNWPEALELVLLSLINQNQLPDEIIIADDGSKEDTKLLIEKCQFLFDGKVKQGLIHVWQEDEGFQLSRIRNKAMAISKADYIVMIDGDMILHPNFIKSHLENAKTNYFIQGSRVLLDEQTSAAAIANQKLKFSFTDSGLTNRANALDNAFLSAVVSKEKNHHLGVRGCNMGFWRKDLLAINGFNEKFTGWGREDSEFVVRILNKGVKRKNLKFAAVAYHLFHGDENKIKNQNGLHKNDHLLETALKENLTWCESGIDQHFEAGI